MRKRLRRFLLDVAGAALYAECDKIEGDLVDGYRAFRVGRVRFYVLGVRMPRILWDRVVLPVVGAAERLA